MICSGSQVPRQFRRVAVTRDARQETHRSGGANVSTLSECHRSMEPRWSRSRPTKGAARDDAALQALRRPDEGPDRPAHVLQARRGRGSRDSPHRKLALTAGGGELSSGKPQSLLADAGRCSVSDACAARGRNRHLRGPRIPRLELPARGRAGQHEQVQREVQRERRLSDDHRRLHLDHGELPHREPAARHGLRQPRHGLPAGRCPAGFTTTRPGGVSTTLAARCTKESASR